MREQKQSSQEKVREKERELQDTKIEEGKKIMKEQRDVEDAANRDANRVEPAPVVVP